jgi:hypothetical protein
MGKKYELSPLGVAYAKKGIEGIEELLPEFCT